MTSTNTNRVIIGHITYDKSRTAYDFWGDTHLRRAEFRAVPGCIRRPHGWGFELPLNTPRKTLDMLSAPLYAPSIAASWKRAANDHAVEYETVYNGQIVRLNVWSRAIVIQAERMTLARIEYNVALDATRNDAGDWELKDRYSRRIERTYTDKDNLSDAARREAWRVAGGLLAGFLETNPQALVEGRNFDLARTRVHIESEIASLQSKIDAKRAELAAVPADEALPGEEEAKDRAWEEGYYDGAAGRAPSPPSEYDGSYEVGYEAGKADLKSENNEIAQTEALPTRASMTSGEAYEYGYTDGKAGNMSDPLSVPTEYQRHYLAGYGDGVYIAETQTESE